MLLLLMLASSTLPFPPPKPQKPGEVGTYCFPACKSTGGDRAGGGERLE
jgi:hypothetical protein